MSRVVVTGLGIVSAAGRGVEAATDALLECRSGLGGLSRFSSPRCGHFPVAEVREVNDERETPRTVTLGMLAITEALHGAGLAVSDLGERAGLVLGMCVGGMPESEPAVAALLSGQKVDREAWLRHECAYTTSALANELALEGPVFTVSNACSSGNQAIATAVDLLEGGVADVIVAGGVDALCRLTLNGFASLLVMDPEGCRPFDRERKGMSLGEGAAFLLLEHEPHARRRGASSLAVVAGRGNTCDAYHATAPDPEGRGAEKALRRALDEAGLSAVDVDYVNAHGTGTSDNDRAEGRTLRRFFGGRVPPVSSTKRVFGHALAAAGAIEAVVSVLALTREFLPGTCGLADVDPECEIEPIRESVSASPRTVLSNAFGFGGSNTVLCFTRP